MTKPKPVREMDAVMIRVPDGMKERIAQRAQANGRSMSAEIVEILAREFAEPNELHLRQLEEMASVVERETVMLHERLADANARREAIRSEMMRARMAAAVRGSKHD